MIVMSIDASSKASGVAIFDNRELIYTDLIKTSGSDLYKRLQQQVKGITAIAKQYKPEKVYIEDVLPEDSKGNVKTFKALIYLQAYLMLSFYTMGLTPELIVASHWRSLAGIKTGRGVRREELKQKAMNKVKEIYNLEVNDDVADAVLIGHAMISETFGAFGGR